MRMEQMRNTMLAAFVLLGGSAANSQAPDPSKLPDVAGVHVGMTLDQAKAAFQKASPTPVTAVDRGYGRRNSLRSINLLLTNSADNNNTMQLSITPPPSPPIVWRVRDATQSNVNRNVLIASLRQKYGKETVAVRGNNVVINDDLIVDMWWVMDEQGNLMSSVPPIVNHTPFGCNDGSGTPDGFATIDGAANCASLVILHVQLRAAEINPAIHMQEWDYPALTRTQNAAQAFIKDETQKLNQKQQQRSKEITPVL